MIILADNTTYTIKDNLDEYLPLQSIANKTIVTIQNWRID